jgi:hypothetical protein
MPEIDVFTQSELQWGALKTAVLGMFYPHPVNFDDLEFSGDLNNFVSAHKYRVYSPNSELLDLIVNSLISVNDRFSIGTLRMTECRLPIPNKPSPSIDVYVSSKDFMGTRTALFGKTRLGKSNIVKLIAETMILSNNNDQKNNKPKVGQVIFDINGEYANDNPQDNNSSLASVYPDKCVVYALTPKKGTHSRPLKLNFYEYPDTSLKILSDLLATNRRNAIYVQNFMNAELPSLEEVNDNNLPENERLRGKRRILMYWAILYRAGYNVNDEFRLSQYLRGDLDPHYNAAFRRLLYPDQQPPQINSMATLASEFELISDFIRDRQDNDRDLVSRSGNPLFERNERALLNFLRPGAGAGTSMIFPFRNYHDFSAADFTEDILSLLEEAKTIIIDLGNGRPELVDYFSQLLSKAVFSHQVDKFSNNKLGNNYVQLYFEEAHNLFPSKEEDTLDIYKRIAKEGAKYHIGMVYSTQSVTSISSDLLSQTENLFVVHLSSLEEVRTLAKMNIAFESLQDDILLAKTVGYVRVLTRSHRFVVSVQAKRFKPQNPDKKI